MSNTQEMYPSEKFSKVGGLWGSRSAWYASTGDFPHWYIREGFHTGPGKQLQTTTNPEIAQCVSYLNEIHAICDLDPIDPGDSA